MLQVAYNNGKVLGQAVLPDLGEVAVRRAEEQLRSALLALNAFNGANAYFRWPATMVAHSIKFHVVAHALAMEQLNLLQHVVADIAEIVIGIRNPKGQRLGSIDPLPPEK